jgi:hypothetical protein
MLRLIVGRDFETSEHAGMGGHYQIATLETDDDQDLVSEVDQGLHFPSEDLGPIKKYLKEIFKQEVEIEFHDPAALRD